MLYYEKPLSLRDSVALELLAVDSFMQEAGKVGPKEYFMKIDLVRK
jgi:hypothetical protein